MISAEKMKAAVIGVGHLGRHHARIYNSLPQTNLVAIADIDSKAGSKIADEYQCEQVTDFTQLLNKVDMVSIAVPTTDHYKIANVFLENGTHVLVEKPITAKVDEGQNLIDLAAEKQLVLMVGQSERFNPAVSAVSDYIKDPKFIEVHRLGPFSTRATDVDVVLDLMIHDLDLILNWVRSDIIEIQAMGVPVLSDRIDIANARIQFKSGCAANITASRISLQATRKVRIFQSNSYISVDCMNQSVSCFRRKEGDVPAQDPMAMIEPVPFVIEKVEPLHAEISAFVQAVQKQEQPPVSGEAGLNALEVCHRISAEIRRNLSGNIY